MHSSIEEAGQLVLEGKYDVAESKLNSILLVQENFEAFFLRSQLRLKQRKPDPDAALDDVVRALYIDESSKEGRLHLIQILWTASDFFLTYIEIQQFLKKFGALELPSDLFGFYAAYTQLLPVLSCNPGNSLAEAMYGKSVQLFRSSEQCVSLEQKLQLLNDCIMLTRNALSDSEEELNWHPLAHYILGLAFRRRAEIISHSYCLHNSERALSTAYEGFTRQNNVSWAFAATIELAGLYTDMPGADKLCRARNSVENALEIMGDMNPVSDEDRDIVANAYSTLAGILMHQGGGDNFQTAISCLEKSLRAHPETPHKSARQLNLAKARLWYADYLPEPLSTESLTLGLEYCELASANAPMATAIEIAVTKGSILLKLKLPNKVIELCQSTFEKYQDAKVKAGLYRILGQAYSHLSEEEEDPTLTLENSIRHLEKAKEFCVNDRREYASVGYSLACVYGRMHLLKPEGSFGKKAISLLEPLLDIWSAERLLGYSGRKQKEREMSAVRSLLIDLLVMEHQYEKAWRLAQRAKAQIITEAHEAASMEPPMHLSEEDRAKWQHLVGIRFVYQEKIIIGNLSLDDIEDLKRIDGALEQLDSGRHEKIKLSLQPVSVEELRSHVPNSAMYVEMILTQDNCHFFCIDRSGLRMITGKISRMEVMSVLEKEPNSEAALSLLNKELPLRSLFDHLKHSNCSILLFCPHLLHRYPIHCIRKENGDVLGDFLVDFRCFPSVNFYLKSQSRVGSVESTVMGAYFGAAVDASLPGQNKLEHYRKEVEIVASLHQNPVAFFEKVVTRNTFGLRDCGYVEEDSKVKNASIVHLSGHAGFVRNDPANSGFVVYSECGTKTEVLSISDLLKYKLFPQCKLGILSACQTASTRLSASDDVIGLHTAMLISGAQQVIATRWDVDDAMACLLIIKFFELVREQPMISLSAALWHVQKSLMNKALNDVKQDLLQILPNLESDLGIDRSRGGVVSSLASFPSSLGNDDEEEGEEEVEEDEKEEAKEDDKEEEEKDEKEEEEKANYQYEWAAFMFVG